MTVTVLAIFDTDFRPESSLGKIMNERLKQAAQDLKDKSLKFLETEGRRDDDVVIYLSYNSKYKIRWRVVNDVPKAIEEQVATVCGNLGYIQWKTSVINVFKGNE
ncbi:hypothetical protein DHW03_02170 [Pedobacter yonginense]|uniref:Uncharacterized protein n=1 Tax=Pedobacter yonginense TaxID=651869 RepID=A0A317EPT5_9SPHI|nr:hypothetical protein [Pedobacter yonginense]PWS28674.1 hypothetical protein DHW03_02170 [Pedobacter yonginense]